MTLAATFVFLAVVQGIQANKLGKPFSILDGLRPVLPSDDNISPLFYPVTKSTLLKNVQHQTTQSGSTYFDDFIQLTFHPDEKDLTKQFFAIWRFEDEIRDAAAFTYQPSSTNLDSYAQLLGITPCNMVGKSYVLARYWKKISSTIITNSEFSNLEPTSVSPDATSDNITDLFSKYGTHYVSGYEMGDFIYQVFVYDKEIGSKKVRPFFPFHDPSFSFGSRGYSFRPFTQPRDGTVGYCLEAGKILAASGDTALKDILPKLKDDVYKVKESIIMFLVTKAYQDTENLKKLIPMSLSFKAIVNTLFMAESPSKLKWNEILSSTIFQKFGAASYPNFPLLVDPNVASFYGSFNPDLVTSTATNFVTISQMKFILDEFVVSNPKFVTHLFIFADVLQISETAKLMLPGSKKIYLVCREFLALSSGNKVPEIIVGSHKNSEPLVKIFAKTFRGVLKLTQYKTDTHYTYANDYVYKTVEDPNDQFTVKVDNTKKLVYPDRKTAAELYDSNGKSHDARWVYQSFVNSLELAATSVQSILAARSSPSLMNTAGKSAGESLNWIAETLWTSLPLSPDLEMVLGRVLLLSKTQLTEYAKSRLIVPRLTFLQYKALYNKLLTAVANYEATYRTVSTEIQRHKQLEKITTSLKELNKNVKSTGTFLVEKAEVNAKYQDDVANTQQALHDLEKDQISRKEAEAQRLLQEIIKIQDEVKNKGDALVKAVKQYLTEQIISTIVSVAEVIGSLFTGGVGLANIDKKLTGIVRIAEKIKNIVQIIEQVNKLYALGRDLRNDIGTVNRALDNIPSVSISKDSFPTMQDWEDFENDVVSFTSTSGFLPEQVAGEALDFQREAKRLSSRGKSYVNIAANIAERKYKQIQIEMQRDLAKRQSARLRTLKTILKQTDLSDNDAKTTDLFEIGNIIKMKENLVRSQLIQTFVTMDAALVYQYLQNPTLVTSYDTMAIQAAAIRHVQSSILALESFPTSPVNLKEPIEYPVSDVAVKALLSEEGYAIRIPLTSLPFLEYVRVRVVKIEVQADNIAQSKDDTAYIQAIALGDSFEDRDLNRNPKSFTSTPTEYRFVYNIKTGTSVVEVNPSPDFADKFIKMTPFDTWIFRFPKASTNEGIQFSTALTTLRIKFFVNVIFHPPKSTNSDQLFRSHISDDVLGSKAKLLQDLSGRSLVREWDAVMAVSAARVNQLWKNKYDSNTEAGFVKEIVTERSLVQETRRFKLEARIIMHVGPPIIQFIRNNQNRATLKIQIKKATLEYWDISKRGNDVDHYNETAEVTDKTEITGTMNLLKLEGSLTKGRVVLDLSDGVFDVIQLPLSDTLKANIKTQIEVYFNTKLKSDNYELARITFEEKLTPAGLVPDKFYLATGGFETASSGYGTLYIFFKTRSAKSTVTDQTKKDFNDPLSIDKKVIPNEFEVALFISNRVIFDDIIREDIGRKFKFGAHTEVLPGQSVSPSQQAVYVKGDDGASHSIYMALKFDRYPGTYPFTFVMPGNTLTVKPLNNGQKLQVHWVNNNLELTIPYVTTSCGRLFCHDSTQYKSVSFSTKYVRNFQASIDSDLTISYKDESGSVSASSVHHWTDFFKAHTYKTARDTITSNVNNYLSGLQFNFRSISAFALTQVLFPNQKVFVLTEVYIPGDMVILGTVNTNPTTAAK
ncbi:uncharacterized protein LOC111335331 [Stylophora pistillata]|nr:uncharacterized protein LOC111335331 [Stylophora pistillata]